MPDSADARLRMLQPELYRQMEQAPLAPDTTPAEAKSFDSELTSHAEPDGDEDMVELEDGSVVMLDHEDTEDQVSKEFDANLAEELPETFLSRLSEKLLESVDRDKKSRSKRDELYAEGIRRTGLGNEAPGGADFAGASRAVHPVLVEACIDFSARAMKELFPAKGPCKTHIVGKQTDEKLQRAERKKTYLNWQLTKQMPEYRTEQEQLLTQLPLGGSQYMKLRQDPELGRPVAEFVAVDDILLPFACTDFYTTPRLTHVQHLTRDEFDSRVQGGLYREPRNKSDPTLPPEPTAAESATLPIEGKEDLSYNEDGLRDVYEVQINLNLEGRDPLARPERAVPYLVTVDEATHEVLAVYRNWKPTDKRQHKRHCIVEFAFIPWRGAYAIGLAHAIGSLAGAATGSLRSLLDAALIANTQAALKLKGGRGAGQNISLEPTQITELEGPAGIDDIRKIAMPLPFPGPSAVLFEVLKYCVDAAKGVVSTAEERIADVNQQMPVGTALALIEQGSVTFSAIHSRLHESQRRVLEILHDLNSQFIDDQEIVEEFGEELTTRADFQGPMDVLPVSDPNIFSDGQRYAQQQAVLQLRGMFPGLFKDPVLVERTLKLLNYPDYEEVLNAPLEPEERDPITENEVARDPQAQLKAYPVQDDMAHLKTHLAFMGSPIFCANPLMGMIALPKLLDHCAEHLIAMYGKHARAASQASAVVENARRPEEAAAHGSVLADRMLSEEIGPLMQHLQAAMQMSQQFKQQAMSQMPPNPMLQVAQVREQGQTQRKQMELQADAAQEQQRMQVSMASEQRRESAESARHTEEMAIAADNARTAEASEQRSQDMQLIGQRMAAEINASMEAQRHEYAKELEELRGQNAQILELLRQQLSARAELASKVVEAELNQLQAETTEKGKD